ncbi:MAG: carboxypeptidase-like regulatory domain-containing protein [Bacteroidetes bacterium]|nr:carboxypeptidase-like regulatory domain-containing protein [Bacteroidota bacterium]
MATAQAARISGRIIANGKAFEFASVGRYGTPHGTYVDAAGNYHTENFPAGTIKLQASSVGLTKIEKQSHLKKV